MGQILRYCEGNSCSQDKRPTGVLPVTGASAVSLGCSPSLLPRVKSLSPTMAGPPGRPSSSSTFFPTVSDSGWLTVSRQGHFTRVFVIEEPVIVLIDHWTHRAAAIFYPYRHLPAGAAILTGVFSRYHGIEEDHVTSGYCIRDHPLADRVGICQQIDIPAVLSGCPLVVRLPAKDW